ncbi:MAG TPA: ATP synthase F1 subunit delta [Candidatus Rubrimentiphilum sp.]|nr:ATP synthase F1 subunit delta [Candidatus Rubrimentiphilum sp.]
MVNQTLARRYATAIFQLASEQKAVEQVGGELRILSDAIEDNESALNFFLSPVVERSEKEQTLTAAFEGKAHPIALHAMLLLVRKRREGLLRQIVREYGALELAARGLEPLTITTAKPLEAGELRQLVSQLEKTYDRKFEVTQRVQPDLIGGVRILMGDRRIDGSIEGRFAELARTLMARN